MKKIFAGLTALAIAGAMAGAVPFAAGSLFDTSVKASAEEAYKTLEGLISSEFANFDPEYIKSIIQDILLENNPDLSEFKMTIDGKVATLLVQPTSDYSGDFVYTAGGTTITVPVSIETDAETGDQRVIADGVRVTGNTPEDVLFGAGSWSNSTKIKPDPDNMPEPKPTTGNTDVLYGVDPAYTVTIPASVDVTNGNKVTSIGFSDVVLENGQSIIVKLTDTANVHTDGATDFEMRSADDSPVIYNIKKGTENVKLGGEAAKFTYNGTTSKGAQELTITKPQDVLFAGSYKDTLTFTISVEKKPTALSATVGGVTFTYQEGDNWETIAENNANISIWDTPLGSYVESQSGVLCKGKDAVRPNHVFDPSATDYHWDT